MRRVDWSALVNLVLASAWAWLLVDTGKAQYAALAVLNFGAFLFVLVGSRS